MITADTYMPAELADIASEFDDLSVAELAELESDEEAARACGFDQLAEAAMDYPELPEPTEKFPMWVDPSAC